MTLSLVAIFGAGLATFASPCVLPLMPVYLAMIAGESLAQARARRTLAVASAFVLGLGVVFVALGALASSVGALLVEHRGVILAASGALMVAFGLRSLGVLKVALLDRDARPALGRVRGASTLAGAFLLGGAFALGWSPCIGPVLATVLTYAATNAQSPWQGAGYLALYAAGLGAPLLLLAGAASRAAAWVGRARSLLPALERITGAALYGLGLWTLFGLAQTDSAQAEAAAASAPVAQAAAAQAGLSCELGEPGSTCGLPALAGAVVAPPVTAAPAGAHLLEFTSRDCPVCQRMRPVLDQVVAACETLHQRVVPVDVQSPQGLALAHRHAVRGTPTLVFIDESGSERQRIIGEASPSDVAAAASDTFACEL